MTENTILIYISILNINGLLYLRGRFCGLIILRLQVRVLVASGMETGVKQLPHVLCKVHSL